MKSLCLALAVLAASVPASAAVTGGSATNDDANVTYLIRWTAPGTFARVYVDADRSTATGLVIGGVGADYLIENTRLYAHAGGGWNWTLRKSVSFTPAATGGT